MSNSPNPKQPILIVEDSPEDYYVLERLLKLAGLKHPIVRCEDGESALDLLHRRGEHRRAPRPLLILLDLNLPGTDGREVLARLKQNDSLKAIPIIVLTTSSDENDVARCYQMGANSYVKKSVNYEGFTRAVQLLVDYWFDVTLLPNKIF